MSKRVEVREGDRWAVEIGVLIQIRNGKCRDIAGTSMLVRGWQDVHEDDEAYTVLPQTARAWIESLGGEWAEVAEEKPATSGTLTMHVYRLRATEQVLMFTEPATNMPGGQYLGTTTITIAGVT